MTLAAIRADVDSIRMAAIDAVRPEALLPTRLALTGSELLLDGSSFSPPVALRSRVVVVGGGKAAAGVAAEIERLLVPATSVGLPVAGLVSVPEGCGRRLAHVEVRETRPLAANLPTPAAVAATHEMRAMLAELGSDDLAIVIVTGGGSALIEEPRDGVSLAGTIALARHLSAAGAGIRDLNTVRQPLSVVKAGGLAQACSAGRLVTLVLSDIIGNPLDLIASGPCMPVAANPVAALDVLRRYAALDVDPAITRLLEREAAAWPRDAAAAGGDWTTPRGCRVSHVLLGTNATAVEAAAAMARRLGYDTTVNSSAAADESAAEVGGRLAREAARRMVARGRSSKEVRQPSFCRATTAVVAAISRLCSRRLPSGVATGLRGWRWRVSARTARTARPTQPGAWSTPTWRPRWPNGGSTWTPRSVGATPTRCSTRSAA